MKKIIFVIGSLVRGGAEKVILELANEYSLLGWQVEIIMLLQNKIEFDVSSNISVIDYSGRRKSRVARIGFWLANLRKHFSRNKGAILVSFIARINILVLLSAKKRNHRIIVSERNDPRYDGRGFIAKLLINILYPIADLVVFQTNDVSKFFSKRIKKKSIVIQNPIKVNEIASLEDYDKNLLIMAGRLAKQKNQIMMINAMKLLVNNHPKCRLEIYGDGDLELYLKNTIAKLQLDKNVFVFPNSKNIQEKIRKSRVYISTSLYEGMSNSLMEASLSGVPCVTTPCLGTDFIHDKINGHFVGHNDYVKLSEVLGDLISNETRYNEMRLNAINYATSMKPVDSFYLWKKSISQDGGML